MMIEKFFNIDRETAARIINEAGLREPEKFGANRTYSTKVFLLEDYAVLRMQNINLRNAVIRDDELERLEKVAEILSRLKSDGVNAVPILYFNSEGYLIMPRAAGEELYDNEKLISKNYILNRVKMLSEAVQSHYDKYISDIIQILETGIQIDFFGKDNFFYDKKIGFQFIDLNSLNDFEYGITTVKPQTESVAAWYGFLPCYYDTFPNNFDSVSIVMPSLTEAEHAELKTDNKKIFKKCRTALLNNHISAEAVDEITSHPQFNPQMKLFDLI